MWGQNKSAREQTTCLAIPTPSARLSQGTQVCSGSDKDPSFQFVPCALHSYPQLRTATARKHSQSDPSLCLQLAVPWQSKRTQPSDHAPSAVHSWPRPSPNGRLVVVVSRPMLTGPVLPSTLSILLIGSNCFWGKREFWLPLLFF